MPEDKSIEQLQAELAQLKAERDDLLTTVTRLREELTNDRKMGNAERLQAQVDRQEAQAERTQHRLDRQAAGQERTRLEGLVGNSDSALSQALETAASDRMQLRSELEKFKIDVDEQLKEMAELRLRSEHIVENLPVGIAYLDKNLVYRWANPTFTHLMKLPFAHVVNHAFVESFPDQENKIEELLKQVLSTGKPNLPVKLPFVHSIEGADHMTHWDLLAIPMVGKNGEVEGVLVAVEVTERVEREKVQKQEIARLIQLDQIKGDLINMVSHELRTPLSTIAGYAEFLEDNLAGQLTEDQRGFVTQIQEAEGRIRRIVDDLLDFARMEAGTFKLVRERADLVALMREELSALHPQMGEAEVQSHLEVSAEPLMVDIDRKRIGQVLLNLVGNAIKFTPAGGKVVVSLYKDEGSARVAISDTGIGIKAEDLPRIFDKFYQVDTSSTREYGGAGLGLAISKTLIEAHGGRIGAESQVGNGSTFWFTLPLAPKSAESPTARDHSSDGNE